MKFISISFIAIIVTISLMNSGYGMEDCYVFKCEEDFKLCKLKDCGSIRGLAKHKQCVETKCKPSKDDCERNCSDKVEDNKGGF